MAAKKRAKKTRPARPAAQRRKPARARAKARARTPARKPKKAAARRPAERRKAAAPAAAPNAVGCHHMHMDYTTHSVDDMKRFYAEVLGFSDVQYDPNVNYLSVRTGPSSSLGFMPPMPGPPESWRPPREPAIYLQVRDVDRAHRDLLAKGVMFAQDPMDMPWGHRVAILKDPEGRTVYLAQAIKR